MVLNFHFILYIYFIYIYNIYSFQRLVNIMKQQIYIIIYIIMKGANVVDIVHFCFYDILGLKTVNFLINKYFKPKTLKESIIIL